MDPLPNQYGPLKDKAIESSILELAQHAGIDGGRVFEVDMSRDTKTMDANVSGFLGTERIVVWDTTIAGLDKRELLTVLAHEMGHYVLGHLARRILVQSFLLLAALGFVHWAGRQLIRKYKNQDLARLNIEIQALQSAETAVAHREGAARDHEYFSVTCLSRQPAGETCGNRLSDWRLSIIDRTLSAPA